MKSWILTLGLATLLGVAAPDGRLAPADPELEERAEEFKASRRVGAWALWGGLVVSSVIIGVVRSRKRRRAARDDLS